MTVTSTLWDKNVIDNISRGIQQFSPTKEATQMFFFLATK